MTEPRAGVADVAAVEAGAEVVLAEAAGAATKPSDKAIAVAAKIVMILVDIAHPPNRVNSSSDLWTSWFTQSAAKTRHRNIKFLRWA
ncbi:hypothetical protein [Nocardia sp. CNY236]|uniref:hypothetical protein n=1 Tax=Nocardia sp. CNY236 TaxID=1169152 RepID=UPI000491BDEF|nr:hypothetical protein [Nocardia sp. CNY236]